jgi:hypothetical protein
MYVIYALNKKTPALGTPLISADFIPQANKGLTPYIQAGEIRYAY